MRVTWQTNCSLHKFRVTLGVTAVPSLSAPDVEGFWQDTTADGDAKTVSESITYTTGRDIAKRVKESGRGSNLSLSQNYNNDVLNKSLYKETFCKACTAPAPGGQRAETETNVSVLGQWMHVTV